MSRAGRPRKTGKREANGRIVRDAEDLRALDQQAGNLIARCREMGLPVTVANLRAMRSQMAGCNAGRAILVHVQDGGERDRLFGAVTHLRQTVARHDAAIGAPRRHAKCLALLVPVDPMQASADSPAFDDRTPEEKARAATSAWMALHGWLDHTDKRAASEAKAVCLEDQAVRDPVGLLSALACVADGMAGRQMQWRGRVHVHFVGAVAPDVGRLIADLNAEAGKRGGVSQEPP